ncbi:GTPase-activating protein S13 [Lecanicillium sp. MT-2017a]|nr:GTPase-activating protein S13 [Lecanicillium sp. MT-2017a]
MSLETSFARFKYLPPELREQVWRYALSEWSVWAPTHAHFNLSVKPIITMEPLGRGGYDVGRVCRESRELMRRTYVGLKPGRGRGEPSGDYWLHPERTILYLGCSSRATDFIEILHAHERLNVAHVVLRVCQDWVEVSRFVYILARNCPDVKTLVLHSIDHKRSASKVCWCETPDPGLADLYKTVVSHGSGSEMPYEESPDGSRFRLSFSEFFGECESEDEDEDEETPGGEDVQGGDVVSASSSPLEIPPSTPPRLLTSQNSSRAPLPWPSVPIDGGPKVGELARQSAGEANIRHFSRYASPFHPFPPASFELAVSQLKMAAQVISNSGHDDMIHDAVLDYYGRKLATCSSDRTIKIFEVDGETQRLIETLKGHEGAVWCVAWAHPKYGNILASAGYDGKVFIWKEQGAQNNQWQRIYDFPLHKASVNIVSWAPHEAGCLLACASSDGNVSVLEFKDNAIDHTTFPAHGLGVNSVSWAPATAPGSIVSSNPGPGAAGNRRFVTGGSDNVLKIWAFDPAAQGYKQEGEALTGHSDWVRDVAWSPTVLKKSYIASASQDKTVRIWTSDAAAGAGAAKWECKVLNFEAAVWRVSWSLSGNVLAVSGADNKVTLWKENLRGEWELVKSIEE